MQENQHVSTGTSINRRLRKRTQKNRKRTFPEDNSYLDSKAAKPRDAKFTASISILLKTKKINSAYFAFSTVLLINTLVLP